MGLAIGLALLLALAPTNHTETGARTPELQLKSQSKVAQNPIDAKIADAIAAINSKDFNKAIAIFRECVSDAEKAGDKGRTAFSLSHLANVLDDLDQHVEALPLCLRSVEILEKLDQPQEYVRAVSLAGNIYFALSKFEKALEYTTRAAELSKKLANPLFIAISFNNLGTEYYQLSQYDKSLEAYKQALPALEKVGTGANVSICLFNLALAFDKVGGLSNSILYYAKALSSFEKQGQTSMVAQTLSNMAVTYENLGQFDKALSTQSRSLTMREKFGDQPSIAQSLIDFGSIYEDLGQFEQAFEIFNRAEKIYEKLGDQGGIAVTLDNLGTICYDEGRLDLAIDLRLRALKIQETLGNQADIAFSLNSLGNAYASLDKYDKALELHNKALSIRERLSDPIETAHSLVGVANDLWYRGHAKEALDFGLRALAMREKVGNKAEIIDSLSNLAAVYESLNRIAEAESCYDRALLLFDDLGRQVGDSSDFSSFQDAKVRSLYARYARLLAHNGEPERGLTQAERGRALGLGRQAMLNEASLSSILGPDTDRYLAIKSAAISSAKLAALQKTNSLAAAGEAKVYFDSQLEGYSASAEHAKRRLEILTEEMFTKHPAFKRLLGQEPNQTGRFGTLTRDNPETLYLEYSETESGISLFALHGASKIAHWDLDFSRSNLQTMEAAYLESISSSDSKESSIARMLYKALLGPLSKSGVLSNPRIKRIVFVPDGVVTWIPLSVLIMPDGKRLFERFAISNAVSLGVLSWPKGLHHSRMGTLVVADSCGGATEDKSNILRGGTFGALSKARKEGRQIFQMFDSSRLLLGPAASKNAVEKAMPFYRILHFACHGDLNTTQAMYSSLVLAPSLREPSDQFLTASEIMAIPLSAELAVLSGCETGQGSLKGGEGLIGLAWAFRAAGCPAVVASKWEVDDAATRRIMVTFYKHLQKRERKDDALQAAMKEEMRQPHPKGKSNAFYWAAFQLIGNTSPIPLQTRRGERTKLKALGVDAALRV